MKLFTKITDVNVLPLMSELDNHPEMWNWDTFWKEFPIPIFREVDTIYLRFPDKGVFERGHGDVETCFDQPAILLLPEASKVIVFLMQILNATALGRVLINRLLPGARVLPHSDGSDLPYSRYHMVLQTNDAVEFKCGGDCAKMKTGEIWWFNNSVEHEVINRGMTPRVHLIADIRV